MKHPFTILTVLSVIVAVAALVAVFFINRAYSPGGYVSVNNGTVTSVSCHSMAVRYKTAHGVTETGNYHSSAPACLAYHDGQSIATLSYDPARPQDIRLFPAAASLIIGGLVAVFIAGAGLGIFFAAKSKNFTK